jgi:hypothetical protein
VIPTQKDPSTPLEWRGAPFFLAANPASVPEGLAWLNKMNADRLKGHLSCINGAVGSNIQADLQAQDMSGFDTQMKSDASAASKM